MSVPLRATGSVIRACRTARPVELGTLVPAEGLIVIAPHPDDETLGCGQALSAAARAGCEIAVVLLTDGESSRRTCTAQERNRLAQERLAEFDGALAVLARGRPVTVERTGLPDGRSTPAALPHRRFEQLVALGRSVSASAVWTTWRGDPHCDHQTGAVLGRRLADRLRVPLWSYPVWGRFGERSHPGNPMLFHDDRSAATKRRAMACYRSQLAHGGGNRRPGQFVMPRPLSEHFATHPEIFFHER